MPRFNRAFRCLRPSRFRTHHTHAFAVRLSRVCGSSRRLQLLGVQSRRRNNTRDGLAVEVSTIDRADRWPWGFPYLSSKVAGWTSTTIPSEVWFGPRSLWFSRRRRRGSTYGRARSQIQKVGKAFRRLQRALWPCALDCG